MIYTVTFNPALDYVMYVPASEEEVEAIFAARLAG